MKLRLAVDAARSRLGRLEILDGAKRYGPFDACATADPDAARASGNAAMDPVRPGGPAPAGTYAMKDVVAVDDARRADLGDAEVMFEPLAGAARRAESLGRLVLSLHGGMLGPDGRMRRTSRGVRVGADVLARIVAAARSGTGIELEIVEVPLTFWDWLFFWRRRPSAGFGSGSSTTTTYRDDDDAWTSSGSSSSSSRGEVFSGKGGSFGGGGASGGWDATTTGTAAAAGAAIGIAGAVAASEASGSDAGGSSGGWGDDASSSGADGGGDSGSSTSY